MLNIDKNIRQLFYDNFCFEQRPHSSYSQYRRCSLSRTSSVRESRQQQHYQQQQEQQQQQERASRSSSLYRQSSFTERSYQRRAESLSRCNSFSRTGSVRWEDRKKLRDLDDKNKTNPFFNSGTAARTPRILLPTSPRPSRGAGPSSTPTRRRPITPTAGR